MDEVRPILQDFVNKFWAVGQSLGLQGFGGRKPPEICIENLRSSTLGYYAPRHNRISLGAHPLARTDLRAFLEILKAGKDESKLKNNSLYIEYLQLGPPQAKHSATLIHELEHARRNSEEREGNHTPQIIHVPGEEFGREFDFEACANEFYRRILPGLSASWP